MFKYVSFANRLVENSEAEGRSLMYIRNSKGPSEEPCGTPQVTFNKLDTQLPILVYCNRLFK